MVTYLPNAVLLGGVPFGGIGTGKVEIDNEGKMVNLTIANNWSSPIPRIRGFHVFVKPDDGEPFFVERYLAMKNFSAFEPDELVFTGEFPFATLRARKNAVEATMEVFSSLVPHNLHDSTIPGLCISVNVKGSKSGRVGVSMYNLAGTNLIGRINRTIEDGILFQNPKSFDCDHAKGELCLVAERPSMKITQFNINVRPGLAISERVWKYVYESSEPWVSIASGKTPDDDPHEILGQWDDPAGLILCDYGDGRPDPRFSLSWYYTGRWAYYPYGHYYHKNFDGAEQVARYLLQNFDTLREKSRSWQKSSSFIREDLPDWLKDAIVNTTYSLFSSTWLDERGRFAIIEATINDPMLGTIAGFCHEGGSMPVLLMFPELEKTFLELLANAARPDGYIPHDLGIWSFDHPTDGTTSPPGWKDLGPSFILLVYRYFKWTNDVAFLSAMYPTMKRTLEWDLKQDKDGDGIPDAEGEADAGFDATAIKGRDSYCSSVFIASLIALIETARILGVNNDYEQFNHLLPKAKKSFSELYNGRYFEAWQGDPDPTGYVFLAQLTGQWWVDLLGLDPIAERNKIDSAFDWMYKTNSKASKYCTPNLVREDGTIWELSVQCYSSWPRLVFGLAADRYLLGDKKWLDVAKKEWDNIVQQGIVWNQPSRIDGRSGKPDPEDRFLDHYIGSAAPWYFTIRPAHFKKE
jgi:non-lysosomal glucosylceramidase